MSDDTVIRFRATVARVQTMADNSLRLVLDLPEDAIDAARAMMVAKKAGAVLEVAAVAINPKETVLGSLEKDWSGPEEDKAWGSL